MGLVMCKSVVLRDLGFGVYVYLDGSNSEFCFQKSSVDLVRIWSRSILFFDCVSPIPMLFCIFRFS